MQRVEMEELRQREANATALQAIGPRKKPRFDGETTSNAQVRTFLFKLIKILFKLPVKKISQIDQFKNIETLIPCKCKNHIGKSLLLLSLKVMGSKSKVYC